MSSSEWINKYYYTLLLYNYVVCILLGGGDIADELRKDNQALRQRIEQLESELDGKNNEIKQMKTSDVVQVSYSLLHKSYLHGDSHKTFRTNINTDDGIVYKVEKSYLF